MSRAQDAVTRARKEIETEAKRVRAELDKQRKEMEKRLKPLQDQLNDLEDALRRLTGREARKPAAKKQPASARAPRGANKAAILAALKSQPGASVAGIATATGIKSTVVSSSLTSLAKQGEVKRTKRNGRVTWRIAA
jgi:predicted Rossmann fold nucleotide-binding protein DprA/Smf involved in DNA uptake